MPQRISPVAFRPNLMSLIVTYQCPLECAHCSIDSGPTRKHFMSIDDIKRYIAEASSVPSIRTIVFTGGEPFLLGKNLHLGVRIAANAGFNVRVVTSGFWARNYPRAVTLLRKLRDDGLKEVNISYDSFHKPWVTSTDVHNAVRASLEVGFPTVISVQVTKSEFYDLARLETELNLRELNSMTAPLFVYIGAAAPVGRGERTLKEDDLVDVNSLVSGSCSDDTGCQSALRQFAVFPGGELHICCTENDSALTIGNLRTSSLADLINQGNENVFFSLLATRGPYGIKEILSELDDGLKFRDWYVNQCHLCKELRARPEYKPALERLKSEYRGIALIERILRVAVEERTKADMFAEAGLSFSRNGSAPTDGPI